MSISESGCAIMAKAYQLINESWRNVNENAISAMARKYVVIDK